jgi:hypothetical protein
VEEVGSVVVVVVQEIQKMAAAVAAAQAGLVELQVVLCKMA